MKHIPTICLTVCLLCVGCKTATIEKLKSRPLAKKALQAIVEPSRTERIIPFQYPPNIIVEDYYWWIEVLTPRGWFAISAEFDPATGDAVVRSDKPSEFFRLVGIPK